MKCTRVYKLSQTGALGYLPKSGPVSSPEEKVRRPDVPVSCTAIEKRLDDAEPLVARWPRYANREEARRRCRIERFSKLKR